MKRHVAWNRACLAASTLCLIAAPQLRAQTANAPAAIDAEDDQPVVLSPFVVEASEDQGYQAKSTLAGTRVRTELRDVASSISVVTKEFLQDTGAVNNESLLQYTTNTEVGGTWGNFSGIAGGQQYNENANLRRPNNNTRVRGLDAADNTRDYFLTEIPWDGFNVDRVDLQRGPNSILFGVGSPAGIINTSVNTAGLANRNIVENRLGSFGSVRFSGDFNFVVIPETLGIRVALLDDNVKYQQEPAESHDQRVFGAIRYAPKLFGEGATTLIRANFEQGRVSANRPRTAPPVDAITPWFLTGNDPSGAPNLNKMTLNLQTQNKGAAPFSNIPWLANGAVGRQFWNNIVAYYGQNSSSTPTAYRQPAPSGDRGIGPDGLPDGGIGGLPQGMPAAIASYSSYATAALPGGTFYADRSLADPSIFNFFDILLDGENKHEWQKWQASNIAISQTFFNDRLGAEFVYDYQRYSDGQRVFLGNSDTYKIGVDINTFWHDGTRNPNVGRAYVANSDESANSMSDISRDSMRFTLTGDVRAEDFLDRDSLLARIIGRHVFTGLLSEDTKRTESQSWATSAATTDYTRLFSDNRDILTNHFRSYDFVAYLSDDLAGRSSAAGANLQGVNSIIKAPSNATVRYFDNKWAKSTLPGAVNYVDPAAAYSFVPQNYGLPGNTGTIVDTTQSENPANYGGWKDVPVTFLNADDGDKDALTYDAQKQRNKIESRAVTWQGHFLDDAFVPVFGWRRDEIETSAASGTPDALGIVNPNFSINSEKKITTGESKSWGGVLRLPDRWAEKLPGKTNIGVFYNESENFKADAPRGDVFGNTIPNPIGKTKEYGVMVSTLNERVSFKATWYETKVANATLTGGGLGQNGYFLWAVPAWGTAFITNADQGLKGNNPNNAWAWNYANADTGETALPGTPAFENHPSTVLLKNAINAWKSIPLEQSFFNAYGNEVALINVAAIRQGNWTVADPIWAQKFDNQPISGGLLAGFGTAPVMSVDTTSKGQEYELIARPSKNWNVAVNASKTFATRESLAPTIESFIKDMTTFLDGPAGDLRLWGGGANNAMRIQWRNNIINPYNTLIAQQGSNAPEIAPWRFNLVTTYNFEEGKLKGAWIGGGYRWEDERVLGYQLKDIDKPALTSIDISKPLHGPDDSHFDMWFGYAKKLSRKVHWRGQVNLRNIGEDTKLVPVSINPDGTVAFSRIQQGMFWQLTNTFEF